MPVARVQTPDGRVMRIEVSQGASEAQILDFARQQFSAPPQDQTTVEIQDFSRQSPGGNGVPNIMDIAPAAEAAPDEPGFIDALTRAFTNRAGNTLLEIPGAIANAAPSPGQLLERLNPFDVPTREEIANPQIERPRSLLEDVTGTRELPVPTVQDIRAAGQVVAGEGEGTIPERFQQAQENVAATDQRFAEEAPAGTFVGETAADIAALFALRRPVRGFLPSSSPVAVPSNAATTLRRGLEAAGKGSKRILSRAAETAAEGATLATLQGADPGTAAATGAAGSAAASLLGIPGRALLRQGLPGAVATGTIATVGLLNLPPGQQRVAFDTFENRSKEAMLWILLGGASARVPSSFAGRAFADLVNVTKRGAVLSALNSAIKDPERTAPVVAKFSEDPDYFGPTAKRRLTRALNSEKIDVTNTVDRLMEVRSFRRKFDALNASPAQPASPVQ